MSTEAKKKIQRENWGMDKLMELQDKIIERHGHDVGYKLSIDMTANIFQLEVYIPRGNGGHVPQPREKLTTERVEQALTDAGYGDQPLNVEEVDGKILVKKTKKVDPWQEVNDVLRGLGLKWVVYDKDDKANTGLWRQP